jgi:hypothetical protein
LRALFLLAPVNALETVRIAAFGSSRAVSAGVSTGAAISKSSGSNPDVLALDFAAPIVLHPTAVNSSAIAPHQVTETR